ncbi:hypothetical protein [Denitromonas sp.]|uniref:hypothetical protein n=1 Tax=Denitromonas sp. TaxID=2734609 RepID=UPI001DC68575|nr:hypothetical protein [Rhodocyclaceae bacterium]
MRLHQPLQTEVVTMVRILNRHLVTAIAAVISIFVTACASPVRPPVGTAPAAGMVAPSDRLIVPGERIGPLRLAGTIADIEKLFGPGTVGEGSPDFVLLRWESSGLWVEFNPVTGNVVWISVNMSESYPWSGHATPEGVQLGMPQLDLVTLMGPPERTVTGGGLTSFYYDRRGIRFTLCNAGPLAASVCSLRIVWPSVAKGDTHIIPGQRISSVELGAKVEDLLSRLGGGYHMAEVTPGSHAYFWRHLGLGFWEEAGRVTTIQVSKGHPADAPGIIPYRTFEGVQRGSTASQVKDVYGEPSEIITTGAPLGPSWVYRSRGIGFQFDDEEKVFMIVVLPPFNR